MSLALPGRTKERIERRQVEALVRAHGREAGAWQILEPGYRWFLHGTMGCVGYVDTGQAWVAAGAPVAAAAHALQVADAFVARAAAHGRRACFFGVEPGFGSDAFEQLRLGEQPEWSPRTYAAQRLRRSLREQHRRARAKGVVIRPVLPGELSHRLIDGNTLGAAIDRLARRWLATRRMAALDFVVSMDPASWSLEPCPERHQEGGHGPSRGLEPSPAGRRLFVAERRTNAGAEVLGAALLLPVPQRRGWFLKHVLRDPEAPNGMVELLVHEVLSVLAREGAEYATLGLAPLAGDLHPALRLARRTLSGAFDFDGLNRFKAKLAPSGATPIHLTYPRGSSAALALYDSLGAFAPRGRLRFALASARIQLERWRGVRPTRILPPMLPSSVPGRPSRPRTSSNVAAAARAAGTVLGLTAILGCSGTDDDAGGNADPIELGEQRSGEGTYYAADGTGACTFDAGTNPLHVAALNAPDWAGSASCGACAVVTGPEGSITVRIVDLCPECESGDLDLSLDAFVALAPQERGRVPIEWSLVPCEVSGPIRYLYKDGSNPWWTAIQIRNHRLPIASVEWSTDGSTFQPLERTDYNYFLTESGFGEGPVQVRVTATDGQVLEDELPPVQELLETAGAAQFR